MITAHILLGTEPEDWRGKCLADIKTAQAVYPFDLVRLPAIPGKLVTARKQGWALCRSKYLTWFDPDDRYPSLPEFFNYAVRLLENSCNIVMVSSCEYLVNESGDYIGNGPLEIGQITKQTNKAHGLQVWRSGVVHETLNLIADNDKTPELTLISLALEFGVVYRAPIFARHWRQHAKQTSRNLGKKNGNDRILE